MQKIKLFYFHGVKNFGDLLNVDILRDLFQKEVVSANDREAKLLMIGSLLDSFVRKRNLKRQLAQQILPKLHVFGSGFMRENLAENYFFFRKTKIHALRGKNSVKRMEAYTGKNLSKIPLGDPALLCPKVYTKAQTKYELGIVAHYVDQQNPLLQKIQEQNPNSVLIDIMQENPINFIEQLTSCNRVISSAMHPLIIADAYGIPSARIILSDRLFSRGGNYKFEDYYSAFHSPNPKIFDLRNAQDIDFTKDKSNYAVACTANELQEIQDRLIASFPF